MTKNISDILKRFDKSYFSKYGGACFECCDFEKMIDEIKNFIISEITKLLEGIEVEKRKEIKLAKQCLNVKGFYCNNKQCLNTFCPLNSKNKLKEAGE